MCADIVLPLHDPTGEVLNHLRTATPILEERFERAIACTTPQTRAEQPAQVEWFERNSFYHLHHLVGEMDVGEQFKTLYLKAVRQSTPNTVLHLAFPDRLAYALHTAAHRQSYLEDIDRLRGTELPVLYQRSEEAWATHPATYRELEGIATRVGEILFGRKLDFGWCYLVIRAGQLAETLPGITTTGLSVLAEILLPLRERVTVRDANWLAWEDPFITGEDPEELVRLRNRSVQDHLKRLSYVIPTLQVLARTAEQVD